MKKVGVLYICSGEYWQFWDGFQESVDQFFLKDCTVQYFRFTDYEPFLREVNSSVTSICQEPLEWPFPTLLRYKVFYDNRDVFKDVDYLIFCNANLKFSGDISLDDLSGKKGMFATLHPGWYNKDYQKFPYETNPKSSAFIERDQNSKYVCGGFNGGERLSFLKMSEILSEAIESDLRNNMIACWHDESHFNKFFNDNKTKFNLLSPSFCSPENDGKYVDRRVTVLDKDKVIGVKNKGVPYMFRYYIVKYIKKLLFLLGLR